MLVLWLIVVVCALLWWRTRHRRSNLDPPEYPGALPLLGHIPFLLVDSATLLKSIHKASHYCSEIGGVMLLRFGSHTDYFITDPDDAVTVGNSCLEKNYMYSFAKPWVGNGLLTGPAPVWKKHRKLLSPTFNQQLIYTYLDIFNGQARRFVDQLECRVGKGPYNCKEDIKHNALEAICKTAMGLNLDDDKIIDGKYHFAVDEALTIFQKRFKLPWLYFDFIFQRTGLRKKQDKYVKILHDVSNGVIHRWRKNNEGKFTNNNFNNNIVTKAKSFLELVMELSEEKGLLDFKEVREEVDTVIVSGYETISCVLLITLVLIGSYPEVQERLVKELKSIFDESNRDVLKEDISRLVFMEAVIKETLRLYSPAPIVARHVATDVKLKNCTLLAGKACFFSIYGINRHPMWGKDADEFRPERWLDQSTLPSNVNAFLAFGVGRRNCIGKTYAMTSLKTTLAHFLRRYKILADHTKLELKIEFLLKLVSGHEITIEARSN